MLIYNTARSGTGNSSVSPGLYLTSLGKWTRVNNANAATFIVGFDASCDFVCTGTSDDVTIQAAINALPASGGSIILRSGTYNFQNGISINARNNVEISGEGFSTIINGSNRTSVTIANSFAVKLRRMAFRYGDVVMLESSYCMFDELDVENSQNSGILLDGQGTRGSAYNTVQNCILQNNPGVGISQNHVQDSKILNNTSANNGLEGLTVDNQSHRCVIAGNRILNNNGGVGQIGVDLSDLCTFTGNIITGKGGVPLPGICFQNNLGSTNYNNITGNTLLDNPGGGILMRYNANSCNFNVVSSNIFRNNGSFSIQLQNYCNGNILTGNILSSNPIINQGTNTVSANNQ